MRVTRREALKYGVSGTAIGLAGCLGSFGGGGGAYPSRPITYIIPYGQGGGVDTFARQMGPILADQIGSSFQFENISGGGGLRGAAELYRAEPDGYTFGASAPPNPLVAA